VLYAGKIGQGTGGFRRTESSPLVITLPVMDLKHVPTHSFLNDDRILMTLFGGVTLVAAPPVGDESAKLGHV